jgi:hypothetical protein
MKAISNRRGTRFALALAATSLLLGACAVMPTGPSVMALPGSGKTIEQYQADAVACQQQAAAVAGSVSYASMSWYQLQRGYDSIYLQCMYASGNRVPAPRVYAGGPSRTDPRYPPPDAPPPANLPPGK